MHENPTIIQMNIAHYRALLARNLDDQKRSTIEQLLAEAERNLVLAHAANRDRT